ncbi:MAG TPA: SRPBCC family protein [Dehalococcoidia bacterium]|nr:SRPBCC family protein [Dehalococcoidia bacterium]
MPRLKAAIEIDAPREHVFAIVGDLSKRPDWTTWVKEVELTSGDGKSQGTTDRLVFKVGPTRQQMDGAWTEFRPPEVFARRFTGYLKGEERLTLTPTDGQTLVEWMVNYTPPFGIIGKVGAFLLMARFFQNELEASLENLKEALEG